MFGGIASLIDCIFSFAFGLGPGMRRIAGIVLLVADVSDCPVRNQSAVFNPAVTRVATTLF
jgi:hypothetical protein